MALSCSLSPILLLYVLYIPRYIHIPPHTLNLALLLLPVRRKDGRALVPDRLEPLLEVLSHDFITRETTAQKPDTASKFTHRGGITERLRVSLAAEGEVQALVLNE